MHLGRGIEIYDEMDQFMIREQIGSLNQALEETDQLITREFGTPTSPEEGDNVIHIDMTPFTEYRMLENETLDLQDLVNVYDRWNDILWEHAIKNVGHYKNKKVAEYMLNLRMLVGTLGTHFSPPPQRDNDDGDRVS